MVVFEFDQGAEFDGLVGPELSHGQLFELLHGFGGLGSLAGLAPGEVGGLQAASVVFILGFALFVGGFGVGGARGLGVKIEFVGQMGHDLLDEDMFVHSNPRSTGSARPGRVFALAAKPAEVGRGDLPFVRTPRENCNRTLRESLHAQWGVL